MSCEMIKVLSLGMGRFSSISRCLETMGKILFFEQLYRSHYNVCNGRLWLFNASKNVRSHFYLEMFSEQILRPIRS